MIAGNLDLTMNGGNGQKGQSGGKGSKGRDNGHGVRKISLFKVQLTVLIKWLPWKNTQISIIYLDSENLFP